MMDDFFFQEPTTVKLEPSKKKQINENKRITTVKVPFKNGAVILMNHPASLTLYKYLSVTVLSGTVSISGYEISKGFSVNVFSSEKTGLVEMKTEAFESIWKKKTSAQKLESELYNIFKSELVCTRVLQKFENSTVAVFVRRDALPSNIEFAEYYSPEAFEFSLCKKDGKKDCLWFFDNKEPSLQFGEDEEKLASEIAVLIRSAKLVNANYPRIIVCGPRNTGKSTMLRYLINKMLSQYHDSCYLDTDPGQPEFTPPGVVSLTEVEKPILGPPFFHLNKKSKMIFVGDISPSFLELYNKSIQELMELYTTEYSQKPLFVNTMGWVEGTGLYCLKETIATVKPTILVEIIPKDGTSMFDYRDYLPPDSRYIQICCNHKQGQKLSSKVMRELSLLSYLGYCQPPYLQPLSLNEICPYRVPWKKIPIFVFPGRNILPSRMIEAINASIVALCCVPETCILESNIPEFPKTLECDPENECLGYGFVQAIDETEHLLYIITPLKKHELARVNAIIKGSIMVPDSLILKQEIYDVPLPYTNVIEKTPTSEEMDISMLSLKYVYESEAELLEETNSEDLFPPLENYRKTVSRRHSHKFAKKFMKK